MCSKSCVKPTITFLLLVLSLFGSVHGILRSSGSLSPNLPFKPTRRPAFQSVPIDSNSSFQNDLTDFIIPAFANNQNYTYSVTLNSSAELYSFNPTTTDGESGNISATDVSGFGANVTAKVIINVYNSSYNPTADTVLFQARLSDVLCDIVRGSPVGDQGQTIIKSSSDNEEPCFDIDTTYTSYVAFHYAKLFVIVMRGFSPAIDVFPASMFRRIPPQESSSV